MAVREEGRPLHVYVIVDTSVHTIHTCVFIFTMFSATTVLCNIIKDICTTGYTSQNNYPGILKIHQWQYRSLSGNIICLKCWEPWRECHLFGLNVMDSFTLPHYRLRPCCMCLTVSVSGGRHPELRDSTSTVNLRLRDKDIHEVGHGLSTKKSYR